MLDAVNARAGHGPPPVEEVVRAFLLPPFERQRAWSADAQVSFLRLVGRIHAETSEAFRAMLVEQFDEVRQRFQAALRRALPDHPDVNWRMLFMIGSMSFTMSWGPMLIGQEDPGHVPEDVIESLVRYTAAGMTAAPSHAAAPVRVVAAAGARR